MTEAPKDLKPITLTPEEVEDPKNKARIAHRTCTPQYDTNGKLTGYTFSGLTESAKNKEEADEAPPKKKPSGK